MPGTVINADFIKASYGAYYINSGQGLKDVYTLLYAPSETMKLFSDFPTTDTKIRKSNARMQSVIQAFQQTWTPKSQIDFVPNEINLQKMKIDLQLIPDEIEQSWLGFLAGTGNDRKAWPIARYLMEVHVIARKDQDMEEMSYLGIAATPTTGTAGSHINACDGIKKQINDFVNVSGRVTPIITGALSSDPQTFVEQVEAFVGQIPMNYRMEQMVIPLSYDNFDKYRQGFRKKYNTYYMAEGEVTTVYNYPNIKVIRLRSHSMNGGTSKLWCTPMWNMLRGLKRDTNQFQVESIDRTVKIFQDWWLAIGFIVPEVIFTNDRDLTNTAFTYTESNF